MVVAFHQDNSWQIDVMVSDFGRLLIQRQGNR